MMMMMKRKTGTLKLLKNVMRKSLFYQPFERERQLY